MARMKRGPLTASALMLIALIVSACERPFSTQPAVTNTPIDSNSLFATPIDETPGMSDVEMFSTGTALALSGTPASVATQTPSTPVSIGTQGVVATATSTPLVSINPTMTSTATLAVSSGTTSTGPLPTSAPVGSRPSTYTLQSGEFPYCIARRYDVDPDALLSLSGLSDGVMYPAGTQLRIPQSGSFPGSRALRNHPASYTVASSNETVYSVACLFGDVDPSAIAQANSISPGSALTTGQQLSIP